MPDITMCKATKEQCSQQPQCRRAQAEPSPHRQSYFIHPPLKDELGRCTEFIQVAPKAF